MFTQSKVEKFLKEGEALFRSVNFVIGYNSRINLGMTLAEMQKTFWDELSITYDVREAKAITKIVFEKTLELDALKLSLERFRVLTTHQQETLNNTLNLLLKHEPVQYVLGEAQFFDLILKVNSSVLIPRPETEELVEWVIEEAKNSKSVNMLDIGTGSGCIAITLSKKIPEAKLTAMDVSTDALSVAMENSLAHKTDVIFIQQDILTENLPTNTYDVIVSNPPYIALEEKESMAVHVVKYEPNLALFTQGNDDLVFYRKISEQALHALKPGGKLFFEIHFAKANEVTGLLQEKGFKNIELRKDLSGKPRMVRASI